VGGQTVPIVKMQEVERRFGCPLIELCSMTEIAGLRTTFPCYGPSIGVALHSGRKRFRTSLEDSQNGVCEIRSARKSAGEHIPRMRIEG
jgi:hypothetical protein